MKRICMFIKNTNLFELVKNITNKKKSRILFHFHRQIIPKRQRLVGGGLERETFPFTDFQKAESFRGYVVEKKSVRKFLVYKSFCKSSYSRFLIKYCILPTPPKKNFPQKNL